MIHEQPQEQKSFVDRIIAPTKAGEALAFEFFRRLFEDQSIKKFEKQKTTEEIELIHTINEHFVDFLESYGIKRIKKIPPENVRILDWSKLNDAQKKKSGTWNFGGRYFAEKQEMLILPSGSKLHDSKRMIHEMLHAQSFLSFDLGRFQPPPDAQYTSELSARRVGLSVYTILNSQWASAFRAVDEAIIEELVKEFYYKYAPLIPSINNEFEEAKKIN